MKNLFNFIFRTNTTLNTDNKLQDYCEEVLLLFTNQ
jgi:hypothetical protein